MRQAGGIRRAQPVPPALAEQMITNLAADAERRVLSAGHMVMMSKPHELATIINDTIARRT